MLPIIAIATILEIISFIRDERMDWKLKGLSIATEKTAIQTLHPDGEAHWRQLYLELESPTTVERLLEILDDIITNGSESERTVGSSTANVLKGTLMRWRNSVRANKPAEVPTQVKSGIQSILMSFYSSEGGAYKRKRKQTLKTRLRPSQKRPQKNPRNKRKTYRRRNY